MTTAPICKAVNCFHPVFPGEDFCFHCAPAKEPAMSQDNQTMSQKYPQYYKKVGALTEIDVYAVHHLFDIQDPSGCIQHASKKLLLSGVRTGGKSALKDIKEARDTLTRWIQLNEQSPQ
jgi:hypothetical protein